MSLDSAITYFRREQEALFRSTCTIARAIGEPTFNPTTGVYSRPTTTVYTGRCLIRPSNTGLLSSDVQAGERELRFQRLEGKFPINTNIQEGDVVTVTASDHDAELVGRTFRVSDVLPDDWQIARVATLEETA